MSDTDVPAPADPGAPAEPAAELAPQAQQRMVELSAMMKEADGEYWHSPELQEEYRALAEADVRGLPAEATAPENVDAWAEHLDVPPEQVLDGMQRAEQITAEVGDTAELETAFSSLSDRAQWVARQALAAPERRIELIKTLTVAEYAELGNFLDAMTGPEQRAVKNALGL
jgi:hypothetical protein